VLLLAGFWMRGQELPQNYQKLTSMLFVAAVEGVANVLGDHIADFRWAVTIRVQQIPAIAAATISGTCSCSAMRSSSEIKATRHRAAGNGALRAGNQRRVSGLVACCTGARPDPLQWSCMQLDRVASSESSPPVRERYRRGLCNTVLLTHEAARQGSATTAIDDSICIKSASIKKVLDMGRAATDWGAWSREAV
jgi:hypothetical protein